MRRVALPVLSAVILLSLGGCAETSSWFGGSNEQAARPIPQQSLQTASRMDPQVMLGKTVVSFDGQKVGVVDDVLMNRSNRPTEIVVSSGGILGVGAHNVAVDINSLRYARDRDELVAVELTREQFANLPAYKDDGRMVSLNRQQGR